MYIYIDIYIYIYIYVYIYIYTYVYIYLYGSSFRSLPTFGELHDSFQDFPMHT